MLTRKQHELLVFINRHLTETGFSPSFEEMKVALGLQSKSGIHRLISALEERGFLSRRRHRARALEVVRMPDGSRPDAARAGVAEPADGEPHAAPAPAGSVSGSASGFRPTVIRGDFSKSMQGVRVASQAGSVSLPLYGRIAAGLPIEAVRDAGPEIEIPASMLGSGDHYALEVAGDSMVDAGIFDSDTVVISRGEQAENGEIVVALIDDGEVTLKRLRRRGASIALEPANAAYKPQIFPADRVKVQGRMVALLRRY